MNTDGCKTPQNSPQVTKRYNQDSDKMLEEISDRLRALRLEMRERKAEERWLSILNKKYS